MSLVSYPGEDVRFRNAFVTTSLCSPSRASYLSGLYAHTHGVQNNFTEFPDGLDSYPRLLQAAGYRTAYIGNGNSRVRSACLRPFRPAVVRRLVESLSPV
jgi:N-acetylglucosamine-6-sulfatase